MMMSSLLLSAILSVLAPGQTESPPPEAAPRSGAVEEAVIETDAPDAGEAARRAGAERARGWFESLTTLSARFEQIAPDGRFSTGELHISRPGRARFDYDDPNPVLVVADGTMVAIADFALETIDRAPISATPLRYLLGSHEALTLEGAVADAGRHEDRLFVTLVDPDGEADGRLTLVFEDPDPDAPAPQMNLAGWYAVDSLGGLTEITLMEAQRGQSLNPRLFVLDDEDVTGRSRRGARRR